MQIVAELFDSLHKDKTISAYIYDELELEMNIDTIANENNISVMCNNIRSFMASFFDIEKCGNIDNLNLEKKVRTRNFEFILLTNYFVTYNF